MAFPRRPRKSQCRTAGKSRPSFMRAARRKREGCVRGDEDGKIEEKDSGTRFGRSGLPDAGDRGLPYTRLKVVYVLRTRVSQKHPQFVKGDPSVPLTRQQICLR